MLDVRPAWSLGFAPRSLIDRDLSGVDSHGPAFAAGLRDGQPLGSWGIYVGDTTKEINIGIREGEVVRNVIYWGKVPGIVRVPVYHPRPDALSIAACRIWAGR